MVGKISSVYKVKLVAQSTFTSRPEHHETDFVVWDDLSLPLGASTHGENPEWCLTKAVFRASQEHAGAKDWGVTNGW